MRFPEGWELILVVLVIVLLFGYKKLPDATRSIGRSMRIFKSEVKGMKEDDPAVPTTTTTAEVTPAVLPPVQPVQQATPPPAPAPAPTPAPAPAPQATGPSRQP
ncbi:MAG: tatA [Frankiales bacterium]|nr:tatA [Frankiales bacterium]